MCVFTCILYTRVNSNEHFHAIKLKKLLVIKMMREECARKGWGEARKAGEGERRKDNKFLHSFNHC